MNEKSDFRPFREALAGVFDYYRQPAPTGFALRIWWQSLEAYPLDTVQRALVAHVNLPERDGQFPPTVASLKRIVEGSTQDSAAQAWAKVERAVKHVGTGTSVAFDDPLIHRVIDDLGGWIELGRVEVDEWPFVGHRFAAAYRAYKGRGVVPDYPRVLIGHYQAANGQRGHASDPPVLLGDPDLAAKVLAGGTSAPRLAVTPAPAALLEA